MITFHQKTSWQKVIFQVIPFVFLVWNGEFSNYMDLAYKAHSSTFQIPFRTCLHCHSTVTLVGLEKAILVISIENAFH